VGGFQAGVVSAPGWWIAAGVPRRVRADGRLLPSSGSSPTPAGRVIAGVCAGLGRRFGLSPWTARILFIIVLMVIPGSQIIIYPILWILMPSE
jgi:phage shock protein PspC (stress-responsive transcriptional regulator)